MFVKNFFEVFFKVSKLIDSNSIDKLINQIKKIKDKKGRIFFIGVGGSAGNASHAVNDFRKICEIECYSPLDNVSELTARINDEGWDSSISEWLRVSRINSKDAIFAFSVGGGDIKKKVSTNIVNAIRYSKTKKAKIFGIVSNKGGYLKKNGDAVVYIPPLDNDLITPIAESYQAVVWHCIVSHPLLKKNKTKW
jgi:D-sedoheptulose 7-phosphate isomerase